MFEGFYYDGLLKEFLDLDAILATPNSEAASQAVGGTDLTFPALHDALEHAHAQTELRPVQDHVGATGTFL